MMDITVPASSSIQESDEQTAELQCKITKDQNSPELGDTSDLRNTPADIELPLSPVLTNSKKSIRYINRRKSRIKLLTKFSQNSSVSQDFTPLESQTQVEEKEQIPTILSTDNLIMPAETSAVTEEQPVSKEEINEDCELEERMKRCIEMQRNKKFCYNIAASSSKLSSTSDNSESFNTFINSNLKIIDSPVAENKSCDSFQNNKSFVSNVKVTDCKPENDFPFKVPEYPVSGSKTRKRREMTRNLETNIKVGFETGSGKKIKLSEKALKRASKLFDDILDIPCESSNNSSSINKNLKDKNPKTSFNNNEDITVIGFKTPSRNTVNLSMNKMKFMFDDIYDLSNYEEIVENDLQTSTDIEINLPDDSSETKEDIKLFVNETETDSTEPQFKTPTEPVDNKYSNKASEGMSPDNKNVSFSQITDTQMCWAAENAECMVEFMDSQWTPSPTDIPSQSQKIQHSNEKNVNKSQDDNDVFSSPESEQLFGNLTVCEDGTVATRNNDQLDNEKSVPAAEFSTASGKKVTMSEDFLRQAKNMFRDCDISDEIFEDDTDKNSDIMPSIEKKVTLSVVALRNANEENLNSNTEIFRNIDRVSEETQDNARIYQQTKNEKHSEIPQKLTEREQKYKESVPSGFLTNSRKKIVISQNMLNKAQNTFEDKINSSAVKEIQFNIATASSSFIVPKYSWSNVTNNSDNKKILDSEYFIDDKEDHNSSDCCGFTWDESLKSLKIRELYKQSLKHIEKDIKTHMFYPFSFTFNDIKSSKGYKNKNYKYAFRYRQKSSVIYGSNKFTKRRRKSTNSSPKISEMLNTTSMVTRSKKSLTPEDINTSFTICDFTNTKRVKKRKDNTSNDSNNSSISNEIVKTTGNISDININNSGSNAQKTMEELEDAFLSCIENTLQDNNSQETDTATDSFFSPQEMDSLNEEFSEETDFDTVLPEHEERIEDNSSDFHTQLEQSTITSEESLTRPKSVTDCFTEETTKSKSTPEKHLEVEDEVLKRMELIFSDCNQELENKISVIATPNVIESEQNISDKKDDILDESLKKVKKENVNNYNTPKTDLKVGFSTASGKEIVVTEENLTKARNIFEDDLNINLNNPQTEGNYVSEENCDTLDKNIESPIKKSNDGFDTAFGKEIEISKESLKGERNSLQDFDSVQAVNVEALKNLPSVGFSTASGKKVLVSEESLMKAKNIFQNCDNTEEELGTPKNISTFGYATASGKEVAISKDSLNKPKNILQHCDIAEEKLDQNIDNPETTSFGFATASGKKVAISEDSLKRAKNILQDCDIVEENLDQNIETLTVATPTGFATASGKKVAVSENSLKRAKNVFQECDIAEANLDQNIDTPKTTSFGFATASGKKVAISEDSLKRAKNILQDCDIAEENLDQNIDTPKTTSFGFATASGKKVAISEDSLKRAKNILQDCNIAEENLDQNIETLTVATPIGFATASGKTVAISEDSLKRAKNVFQDCYIAEANLDQIIDTPKTTSFGFATASGKKVAISEESLKKAKNIFQDCDINEDNLDKNNEIPKTTSCGFATASGKKVAVSEEALEKAKSMFYDANKPDNEQSFAEPYSTPKTSMKSGFSTASGNKVIISEEALNKARNRFEDNVDSTEVIPKEVTKFDCSMASGENKSMLTTPKNYNISEPKINSTHISKSKAIQRTDSSPAVAANKSYSSPQVLTNDSTPILRNKTLSSRNSKKRSLGVTTCRQIDIPETSMKRAKLVFDDVDSPMKKETTINNNHIQNYSPLANKTNIPQNVTSRSAPNIPTENKSLLNSTISMKESNQQKITQNLATPKISPLKKLCLGNENMLDNSSFVFQKKTSGDVKKWKIDLQKELDLMKLKMSVMETRMQLLNKQQEVIEIGSPGQRRQHLGCLFTQKLNSDNRISLKEAVKNHRPQKNTHQICLNMGVDRSLLDITADNSSALHFHVPWWPNDNRTYPAVIRTEDGAYVVPNQQNFVGIIEIETAFLAMRGVDPSLVPKNWVTNHYRWIVWKLASLERNYPVTFKNCLTVESVISQLKYRYDREIDRAQRPALRKITECDDTGAKRMVLCVATIIKLADNRHELELTDGWYSIKTMLDAPLNSLVERNVIKVGMKLMIQGAELQNCEGCCPLELPSNVRLQIHYNSTRRAAWYVKLGYQPNPGPLLISLRMIAGNGGPVGGVCVYVARVYPINFMERCNESITWRNQRAEQRRANQWEAVYSNTMETMQMKVQEELEKEWGENEKKNKNKRVKIKDVTGVLCGETLYQFMEDSNDPDSVKELLTPDQISALQDYQSQLNLERQSEVTTRLRQKLSSENIQPRNVSTVLKLLLVDVQSLYHHRMLSVWRPTETHTQLLKEGLVINIYNVTAKNNGTLASVPRTQFDVVSDLDVAKFENMSRFIIPISQTANPELKPQFGEFDTIGIVVTIDVQPMAQTIWIADENYRFLLVKIREGPETCCLFDGITPGKIVAVMNLIHQKPFNCYGEALANQYSVVSSYPQQAYLQDFMKEFIENLSESQDVEQYLEECKSRVEVLSAQNLKHGSILNPLNVKSTEEEDEPLIKKLCGIESTQDNKSDSLTLSDEEMALIDTQTM